MKNSFKGNSLFNDVQDPALRTWNRAAVMFNLMADRGIDTAKAYMSKFDEVSRKQVYAMLQLVQAQGYEETKKKVIKGEYGVQANG